MKKISIRSDQRGMTMIELVVSFALLAIFMVMATFIISYTVQLYHSTKGATYGLEVSNMISNKVVGQIETASNAKVPVATEQIVPFGNTALQTRMDSLSFVDGTGSSVTISASPQPMQPDEEGVLPPADPSPYICIHYDEVKEGSIRYEAVDWRFDRKAYMGYCVKELRFENPNAGLMGGPVYPKNVIRMVITLSSDRYGDYTQTYYMKLLHVEEIMFQ